MTALAATVIIHAVVVVLLLTIFLRYNGAEVADREWPPVDSSEILFGGEYVMTGDIAELTQSDDSPAASETADGGAESVEPQPEPAPEPFITAKETSQAKASPSEKPDAKADARRREEEQRKALEEKRRQEEAAKINSRVQFGSGTGKTGQPDGNSTNGAVSGVAASGLGNRQALHLPSPPRGPMGKIVVSIKVDRQGNVTSATFLSGSGAAGASQQARSQCIAVARQARFSAAPDAPVSQTGTLTYVYK